MRALGLQHTDGGEGVTSVTCHALEKQQHDLSCVCRIYCRISVRERNSDVMKERIGLQQEIEQ